MIRQHVLPLGFLLSVCLAVTGCTYDVAWEGDVLAVCRVDAFNAFCQVKQPIGTSVVTGSPVVSSIGTVLGGVGSLMIGQGALVSGAAVLVK